MKTKILFIYNYVLLINNISRTISYIGRIATELKYDFILITNKINLGTESSPRIVFNNSHELMLKYFKNEGINLSSIYLTTLKKNIILLNNFSKVYNIYNYLIIGNRIIQSPKEIVLNLQKSLNSKWKIIYNFLKFYFNECSYRRKSKETDIQIFIKINSKGISDIQTGFGFFNHILEQICIHANLDLGIKIKGDIHIDEHHTLEDTAIAIGIALSKSLKDKRGISRYGFLLPMDDVLVQVAIDLGGRSNLIWKSYFKREKIGDVPTEMFVHFFKSFSDVSCCNLNIQAEGDNEHHKIEAIFKAFACSLKMATSRNHNNDRLPSTKELL